MIEVDARAVKPTQLFGDFGRWYEWKGVGKFFEISESLETMRELSSKLGLEMVGMQVADKETVWRVCQPHAAIGEEKIVLHEMKDGSLWVTDTEVDKELIV